jgi:hypothetical protein
VSPALIEGPLPTAIVAFIGPEKGKISQMRINMAGTSELVLVFCCTWMLLSANVDAKAANQRSILSGPLNTAVDLSVADVTTALECEASGPRPATRVTWTEYITNVNGAPISDNEVILGGHPNANRYSIDWDGNAVYNLVISPTQLEDGGTYRCIDVNDASNPQYAQVITIAGAPNCTTNLPDTGLVLEFQYYTYECIISYSGKVAPTMTWTGPPGFSWTTATTPTTVWAGFAVNVTRFMSAQTFQLVINFTADGFQQDNYATNVPTWNYTVSTSPLDVKWGPQSMYYAPVQATYEIGTEIQCFADSNPPSNFFWQNLATNERWDDYRLYTYDNMIGSQPVWCHAQNIIANNVYSSDLFFNLTVNPRTTTPVPTTTPTTTLPAPEADCDDLSGRWSCTSPNRIEMCLEVNNTNYGRIVGLLRNESDPYFVDIRGRAVPFSTRQFGMTGIWPFNLEVISFVGTCKKCFGEEILWVNAVARTTQDNTQCENAAAATRSVMYKFSRTGPPCRGLKDGKM